MKKICLIATYSIVMLLGLVGCGMKTTPQNTTTESAVKLVVKDVEPAEENAQHDVMTGDSSIETGGTEEKVSIPYDIESVEVEDHRTAYEYTFNPCVISEELASRYDKKVIECYFEFCEAVYAGDDSFYCPDYDTFLQVNAIACLCHPLYEQFIDLSESDEDTAIDNRYPIAYTLPKDEYMEKLKAFKEEVSHIITSTLQEGDTELEKAIKLYSYIGKNMKYDYDLYEYIISGDYDESQFNRFTQDGLEPSPYRALIWKEGICDELASAYSYLLLQVGVEAVDVDGEMGFNHEWNMVRIDDVYYHVDPTAQVANDNFALCCFAVSTEYFIELNEVNSESIMICGATGLIENTKFQNDSRFESLGYSNQYEIDHENRIIYYMHDVLEGEFYVPKVGEYMY